MARPARRSRRGPTVSISIEGLKEVDKAIGELMTATNSRTAKNAIRRGLIKAGEPMAERMRQLAPVGSGALRDSIIVSAKLKNPVGKAEYARVMAEGGTKSQALAAKRDALRAAAGTGSTVEVFVGPSTRAPHAHLLEFGTVHAPPQPYARPAFEETREAAVGTITDAVRTELEKAAARAARKAAKLARRP